jgi:hypothetical protein
MLVEALCYKPEVTGSIPDEVTSSPSSRNMAVGSTQPLTKNEYQESSLG